MVDMRKRSNATVTEIAAHWVVTADTARTILKAAAIQPVSTGPARYRWRDIWNFEGSGWVAPHDEAAFRAPLAKPDDLEEFCPGVPERTITDQAVKNKMPAIRIGKQWRFRRVTLARWQDDV
jgi:hypothetical protein